MKTAKGKVSKANRIAKSARALALEPKKLKQSVIEVPAKKAAQPYVVKKLRVPALTNLNACQIFLRRLLRWRALDYIGDRKHDSMRRNVMDLVTVNKYISAEDQEARLTAACESLIAQGRMSRADLPLLFAEPEDRQNVVN